eukprot:177467_1
MGNSPDYSIDSSGGQVLSTVEIEDPILDLVCEDCDEIYANWNLTDALTTAIDYSPSIREGYCSFCSDHDPAPIKCEGLRHPGQLQSQSPYNHCFVKCDKCRRNYGKFNWGIGHELGFGEEQHIRWTVGFCVDCKGSWSKQPQFRGLTKSQILKRYNDDLDYKRACEAAEKYRENTANNKVSAYIVYDNTKYFNYKCGGLNVYSDKTYRTYGKYSICKFEATHRKNAGATFSADMNGSLLSIFNDIKNTSSCSYIAFEAYGKTHPFWHYYGNDYNYQKGNKKFALSLV